MAMRAGIQLGLSVSISMSAHEHTFSGLGIREGGIGEGFGSAGGSLKFLLPLPPIQNPLKFLLQFKTH